VKEMGMGARRIENVALETQMKMAEKNGWNEEPRLRSRPKFKPTPAI